MVANLPILYVHSHASEIAKQNALSRRIVEDALEVLRKPMPDTFLGRKTHEPLPWEPEEDHWEQPLTT